MGSPHCASRKLSMDEMGGNWNEPRSSLPRRLGGQMGGSLMVSPTDRCEDVGESSIVPCDDALKRDEVDDNGLGYGE